MSQLSDHNTQTNDDNDDDDHNNHTKYNNNIWTEYNGGTHYHYHCDRSEYYTQIFRHDSTWLRLLFFFSSCTGRGRVVNLYNAIFLFLRKQSNDFLSL